MASTILKKLVPSESVPKSDIIQVLNALVDGYAQSFMPAPYSEAPESPAEGMLINADGTNFDPGAGAGLYHYHNGAWVPVDNELSASEILTKLKTVDGSGSGLDADKLDGLEISSSGDRWGVIPSINTSGVMEIGKYIDFHESDSSSGDYNTRLVSVDNLLHVVRAGTTYHVRDRGMPIGTYAGTGASSYTTSQANTWEECVTKVTCTPEYAVNDSFVVCTAGGYVFTGTGVWEFALTVNGTTHDYVYLSSGANTCVHLTTAFTINQTSIDVKFHIKTQYASRAIYYPKIVAFKCMYT